MQSGVISIGVYRTFSNGKMIIKNNRKRVGDRTEPCGTPMFIGIGSVQLPSTAAVIDRPERKLEIKVQREG